MRDLDLLLPEYETVKFRGKEYQFPKTQEGRSVEAQIAFTKFAQAEAAVPESEKNLFTNVPLIKDFISWAASPRIPLKDLEGIPARVLEELMAVSMGKTVAELEEAGKRAEGKKKTKAKKKDKRKGKK